MQVIEPQRTMADRVCLSSTPNPIQSFFPRLHLGRHRLTYSKVSYITSNNGSRYQEDYCSRGQEGCCSPDFPRHDPGKLGFMKNQHPVSRRFVLSFSGFVNQREPGVFNVSGNLEYGLSMVERTSERFGTCKAARSGARTNGYYCRGGMSVGYLTSSRLLYPSA